MANGVSLSLSLSLSLSTRSHFGQFVLSQILNGLLRATEIGRALNNGSTGTHSESGTKRAVEIIRERTGGESERVRECGNGAVRVRFFRSLRRQSSMMFGIIFYRASGSQMPSFGGQMRSVGRGRPPSLPPLRPVEGKAAFVLRRETINSGPIVRSTILS